MSVFEAPFALWVVGVGNVSLSPFETAHDRLCPLVCAFRSLANSSLTFSDFQSRAFGVGHIFTAASRFTCFPISIRRAVDAAEPLRFWSPAVGVGHSRPVPPSPRTASVRLMPGCALLPGVFRLPAPLLSDAVGVGHILAYSASGIPPWAYFELRSVALSAVGVGNNPDAITPVRGADGGSRYAIPESIIPERGQVSENGSEPETKQACDVLHDDDLWS